MDSTTRRKIDALRDTLVGKLPVPTQQVEQITLALLYKFMYDLDSQNVELGGARQFFTNGYKRYAWNNIIDKSLSGAERVAAYGEALEKMSQNPKLPQLFRDIFARAYLPFRDPQTLNLFLQQIDDFTYEHSEDLGDAFEYLLSIMGSQGDAGQFRTPRHIIDFIVAAVDPDLDMRILDPACGTAGFLISAYKHIMMKYADDKGKPGAKLTPAQKKKLAQQFTGYDISHDMVRLSLVNMYLHNLPEPKIYEYDALTSEDKWGERAECILANPPFMSPKGGIRPHKKFAINATRSEVLFADYMLEHLTTGGRAGFIVPEGIIFQSGTAYKALRKMLVEDGYLWAVVSLPAGVFQPYSGVKTSILLIDRNLAKQNENILFLKIENDGFDLGAQRRAIEKNDLPGALDLINEYKTLSGVGRSGTSTPKELSRSTTSTHTNVSSLLVPKEKIAASGDYNLSMDRYRESYISTKQQWPIVSVEELCELGRGRVINKQDMAANPGVYPVYSSQTTDDGIFGYLNTFDFEGEYVTWTTDGANAGTVFYRSGKFNCTNVCGTLKAKSTQVSMKYLAYILNTVAYRHVIQLGNPKLMNNVMAKIRVPLPLLPVQESLVVELERYRKMIEGARAILANYKPEIEIDPKWELRELGEVFKLSSGKFLPEKSRKGGPYKVYGGNGVTGMHNEFFIPDETLVIGRVGEYCGAVHLTDPKSWITDNALYVTEYKVPVNPQFLYYTLLQSNLNQFSKQGGQPSLSQSSINIVKVPIPPLTAQQTIVVRLESERAEMEMLKGLIVRMEIQIKAKVAGLWGE